MQLINKLPTALVVILSLFLAQSIAKPVAAPQGNELYQEVKEAKHGTQHKVVEEVNAYVEHHIEIREAEEEKSKICGENVKEKDKNDSGEAWKHHIEIREAGNKDESVIVVKSCNEVGIKTANAEHKILVRQTEQSGNRGELDAGSEDLVASLIRQRDDFIAAAAIPERPLPVQNVRLNLNSGL